MMDYVLIAAASVFLVLGWKKLCNQMEQESREFDDEMYREFGENDLQALVDCFPAEES